MAFSQSLTLISKCTIFPDQKSIHSDVKLSVSDLSMLFCHYIQKGGLFARPPIPIDCLFSLLQCGLSQTFSHFPPLTGCLNTDPSDYVYITCNDGGVNFIHASAIHINVHKSLSPIDVPNYVKEFFVFDRTVSYDGYFKPILAVQVTELANSVFIGCSLNHAIIDGMSFWSFFNTFTKVCGTGAKKILRVPDFRRELVLISPTYLKVPECGPKSWCALPWLAVTCSRKLPSSKMTTFRMAVNCCHRLEPKLDPYYFENAIQSISTYASVGDVLSRDLRWCVEQLNKNVTAHVNATVRRCIDD
ncbi:unnamed protein product [Ilex paraguariensis]|uniref:Uncharacterized protein n=1 Tax=Ilex paraguariensis TaxID=185542 RepID=A0ABC8QSM0_9AQUA